MTKSRDLANFATQAPTTPTATDLQNMTVEEIMDSK
jgi:hypothetical protein